MDIMIKCVIADNYMVVILDSWGEYWEVAKVFGGNGDNIVYLSKGVRDMLKELEDYRDKYHCVIDLSTRQDGRWHAVVSTQVGTSDKMRTFKAFTLEDVIKAILTYNPEEL